MHLQCEWRIVGPGGIVVGMNDRYFPTGDYSTEPPDFDWRVQGSNRMDERLSGLMQERQSNPLTMRSVCADHTGSFRLGLSDDYSLEVFPCETTQSEFWRLFVPTDGSPHFVVTGLGIQA